MYRPTDRFENWFITSLQTDVNDTTTSFRLNKALNVNQCRLVIDPYDETKREIVKVTSVDGNLVYVERGDDNTAPEYHNEGTIVALHVIAADLNDLYADWAEMEADYATEIAAMHTEVDTMTAAAQGQVDAMVAQAESDVAGFISNVEAAAFLGAHPVGSTYWNETDSRNPGTVWGGTWVALKGVVLGGKSDVAGSPFNVAAGTTIGADTHTLTNAQVPPHWHSIYLATNHGDGEYVLQEALTAAMQWGGRRRYRSGTGRNPASTNDFAGENEINGTSNRTTASFPIVQRTLVGYLWKRTA